jgi:hypothetical protein
MLTVTLKIRHKQLIAGPGTQLLSRLGLGRRLEEPEDGWFTLQGESSEDAASGPAAPTRLRDQGADRVETPARAVWTIRRARRGLSVLGAVAVTGALAAAVTGASSASHSAGDNAIILAQRAKIAQLSDQRNHALAAAQQAQSGQAAWRAQAIRWRSRAIANRRRLRRRPARGRQRPRPRRRRS